MKIGTVALVIQQKGTFSHLIDTLFDDREIETLEKALNQGKLDPLSVVYQFRIQQAKEDEEFGEYVETLLSKPFLRSDIKDHGVQWLKSKIRLEKYRECEMQASQVIAHYALQIFKEDPEKIDFILAGPSAKVRVRIFVIDKDWRTEFVA